MPLGILDTKFDSVPGTAPLTELGREAETQIASSGVDTNALKRDPTGEYILVPQPSDSPNDPYNWPKWRKEMFTVAMVYGCGCVGAAGPIVISAFVPLAEQFGVSLQLFSLGCEGALIACAAVGAVLANVLAVKFGKRPIYLVTSIGLFVTSFWAAEAGSFTSLVVARSFQGICMAPMQSLIPASIADIWHVHERGYRNAIFNLGLLGGISLTAPIAGPILQYGSFRIGFHALGGACVLQFILTLFFMPETAFHRPSVLEIAQAAEKRSSTSSQEKASTSQQEDSSAPATPPSSSSIEEAEASTSTEARKTFVQELAPWSGYYHKASFWKTLIRPFFMLSSPVVIWATLLFTTCISWIVLIHITISQIFSVAPYNWSIAAVGAVNITAVVANLLGTAVAGPVVDGIVKRMSKANGGIFEPEFRLPIMCTYLLFTATGFFAWGQSLHAHNPWPVPVIVALGLINLGIQLGTTGIMSYVADCHREYAAEAFGVMNFVKNIFAFSMTFYANDWIARQGVRDAFFVIGGLTAWASLLTVPMYIYGKRARSFIARKRFVSQLD